MAQFLTGSICLTDLIEQAKKKHSAFSKSERNQKIYANIKVWINDEKNQHGNIGSLQLNPKKDHEKENVYIGNLKDAKSSEKDLNDNDIDKMDDDFPY